MRRNGRLTLTNTSFMWLHLAYGQFMTYFLLFSGLFHNLIRKKTDHFLKTAFKKSLGRRHGSWKYFLLIFKVLLLQENLVLISPPTPGFSIIATPTEIKGVLSPTLEQRKPFITRNSWYEGWNQACGWTKYGCPVAEIRSLIFFLCWCIMA